MKILEVLNEFYGDFEFEKEKWNEKYEGILIKIKEEQGYKRCRLAKKTPKKGAAISPMSKPPPRHSRAAWPTKQ